MIWIFQRCTFFIFWKTIRNKTIQYLNRYLISSFIINDKVSCRCSHERCSVKKGVLKNLENFIGNHQCWCLFLKSCRSEYCEIFKSTYFEEHLRTTASDIYWLGVYWCWTIIDLYHIYFTILPWPPAKYSLSVKIIQICHLHPLGTKIDLMVFPWQTYKVAVILCWEIYVQVSIWHNIFLFNFCMFWWFVLSYISVVIYCAHYAWYARHCSVEGFD